MMPRAVELQAACDSRDMALREVIALRSRLDRAAAHRRVELAAALDHWRGRYESACRAVLRLAGGGS